MIYQHEPSFFVYPKLSLNASDFEQRSYSNHLLNLAIKRGKFTKPLIPMFSTPFSLKKSYLLTYIYNKYLGEQMLHWQ